MNNQATAQTQQPGGNPDPADAARQRLRSRQRFWPALAAGAGALVIGALLWALITSLTGLSIGVLSIGVGFLIAYSIRTVGLGVEKTYGFLGGALALIGSVLGAMLAISAAIAKQGQEGILVFWSRLEPDMIGRLLQIAVRFPDVLFYLVAVYIGYKFSFKEYSEEELEQLGRPSA
jgi:hypothetical protein